MPAFEVEARFRTRLSRVKRRSEIVEADTKEELDRKILAVMVAIEKAYPGAVQRGLSTTTCRA
jgi:hypothetical protein